MGAIASQITSLTIVYSTVYPDADQRKHQSSASLAFVRGIHRGPVNSPHKWSVTRKMFSFDDVIMTEVKILARSLHQSVVNKSCTHVAVVHTDVNFNTNLPISASCHSYCRCTWPDEGPPDWLTIRRAVRINRDTDTRMFRAGDVARVATRSI